MDNNNNNNNNNSESPSRGEEMHQSFDFEPFSLSDLYKQADLPCPVEEPGKKNPDEENDAGEEFLATKFPAVRLPIRIKNENKRVFSATGMEKANILGLKKGKRVKIEGKKGKRVMIITG